MVPGYDFRQGYCSRVIDTELGQLLPHLPAILLDGPKAVGKTRTAQQLAQTVVQLSDPAVRAVTLADPRLALVGPYPVLLDEWHRAPAVWDAVKLAVDEDLTGGRYILTGSAPSSTTHSGAGRIPSIRMRPLTLLERGVCQPSVSLSALLRPEDQDATLQGACALSLKDYADLIVDSGFPGLQQLPQPALRKQLEGYIERLIEVELPELGVGARRPASVRAWLRAYAAATATTARWETIRDGASAGVGKSPARPSAMQYVEALTRLRILDDVEAWSPSKNHMTRASQTPKRHLADPALAAHLVGASASSLLRGEGPNMSVRDGFIGALFESLCTLSVRVFADACDARTKHFRLHDGRHEVDLIVERADESFVGIEVKLSPVVSNDDVKHLVWLKKERGDEMLDAVVLTTGAQAYRRPDGVGVIPLGLLGP